MKAYEKLAEDYADADKKKHSHYQAYTDICVRTAFEEGFKAARSLCATLIASNRMTFSSDFRKVGEEEVDVPKQGNLPL